MISMKRRLATILFAALAAAPCLGPTPLRAQNIRARVGSPSLSPARLGPAPAPSAPSVLVPVLMIPSLVGSAIPAARPQTAPVIVQPAGPAPLHGAAPIAPAAGVAGAKALDSFSRAASDQDAAVGVRALNQLFDNARGAQPAAARTPDSDAGMIASGFDASAARLNPFGFSKDVPLDHRAILRDAIRGHGEELSAFLSELGFRPEELRALEFVVVSSQKASRPGSGAPSALSYSVDVYSTELSHGGPVHRFTAVVDAKTEALTLAFAGKRPGPGVPGQTINRLGFSKEVPLDHRAILAEGIRRHGEELSAFLAGLGFPAEELRALRFHAGSSQEKAGRGPEAPRALIFSIDVYSTELSYGGPVHRFTAIVDVKTKALALEPAWRRPAGRKLRR